jgi:four helix bundle protein
MSKSYDLEERFENFAVEIISLFDKPATTYASKYYAEQLIRSSGSVSLNFSEFGGAGTEKDKLNKLRIALKEMRECHNNIRIQFKAKLNDADKLESLHDEAGQLVKILVSIINKRN